MIYPIVRPLAAVALKVFFRKIHLTNKENIPKDKPVIIAANHPTAFLEPCVLACFLDRPLYFLVRGDLFVKPFYTKLLNALHMLPVYRKKDRGFGYLKQNYSTFEACYDALAENKTIMILAEGRTINEKRLRPIQKGTARLAFGALEKYQDLADIYIVPTGVNYTFPERFRSDVMIDFGEPILARDYMERYEENQMSAINSFTDDLREQLEKLIIIIQHPEDELLTEQLFSMYRSEYPQKKLPIVDDQRMYLETEKAIGAKVTELPESEKNILRQKVGKYFALLHKNKVEDQAVVNSVHFNVFNTLILLLGVIPAAVGYFMNYLPLRMARFVADTRVKAIEFYSSVMVAVGIGTYLIYFILMLVLALIIGKTWFWALLIATPLLGFPTLWWISLYKKWNADRKWEIVPAEAKEELKKRRKEIKSQFTLVPQ